MSIATRRREGGDKGVKGEGGGGEGEGRKGLEEEEEKGKKEFLL